MILSHTALPKHNHPSGSTYYNLSHLRTRINTLMWPAVRRWLHSVSPDWQKLLDISHLNFVSLDWLPIDQVQQKANAGILKAVNETIFNETMIFHNKTFISQLHSNRKMKLSKRKIFSWKLSQDDSSHGLNKISHWYCWIWKEIENKQNSSWSKNMNFKLAFFNSPLNWKN